MFKPLRKRHLQIWTVWAVLIPIGIIVAWMAVPEKPTQELLQEPGNELLPVLVKSVERSNYRVNLKVNADKTQYQLEWINKVGSTMPSSLIYKISQTENELIGRVESRGVYHFSLAKDTANTYHFILHDIIRQQTIDSLKFSAEGGN
jgi:hypothetical protein